MNRKELREEFGGRIIFHGGVDIQYVLPKGTIKEVEDEVVDVIETFAPGYIFSPAHNIQADVPPHNIIAAYKTAITYNPFAK
jgi:uroporphyrinogen decarboxylase